MERLLNKLAEQVLNLDEASLTSLLEKYQKKVNNFEPTREWERAVIVLFMINGVKAKNMIFNEEMLKRNLLKNQISRSQVPQDVKVEGTKRPNSTAKGKKIAHLKVIK